MSSEETIEWTRLGKSGLKISKIVLGCLTFGKKEWVDWVEDDEEKVFAVLKKAYDVGIRTYDTADAYSNGQSEVLLGKFLKKYNIKRDKVVILTKIHHPIDDELDIRFGQELGPGVKPVDLVNSQGLSRKHVFDAAEGSVRRLGTYIDVLQIHRLDKETEPEEIMRALNDVVEKGFTRYIGASSMRATEFVELQFMAEKHGWHKFISVQNFYNLLYREEEREMLPFVNKNGLGVLPWSPLARGILARPADIKTARQSNDANFKNFGLDTLSQADVETVNRVGEIAEKRNVSRAIVATSWVLSKGYNPIVGANKVERVIEALQATKFELTDQEVQYLEEPYEPKRVFGYKE